MCRRVTPFLTRKVMRSTFQRRVVSAHVHFYYVNYSTCTTSSSSPVLFTKRFASTNENTSGSGSSINNNDNTTSTVNSDKVTTDTTSTTTNIDNNNNNSSTNSTEANKSEITDAAASLNTDTTTSQQDTTTTNIEKELEAVEKTRHGTKLPATGGAAAAGEEKLTEAEEEEEIKDMEAAKFVLMAGITTIVATITLYFGLKWAKKRYMGEESSVRISIETRGRPSLGGPFTLVTTDGEPVSQSRFLGKWTFFYFGFVHCPEICPIELNRMTKVIDAVQKAQPNDAIVPLFVSCDPKRDSLMAIKDYLSIFHKDFIGLVGTPKQVNDACKSYRVYYSIPDEAAEESGDYLIDHSIAIFLFDPQGRFVDFFGNRYSEEEITDKVLSYMDHYHKNPSWTNY